MHAAASHSPSLGADSSNPVFWARLFGLVGPSSSLWLATALLLPIGIGVVKDSSAVKEPTAFARVNSLDMQVVGELQKGHWLVRYTFAGMPKLIKESAAGDDEGGVGDSNSSGGSGSSIAENKGRKERRKGSVDDGSMWLGEMIGLRDGGRRKEEEEQQQQQQWLGRFMGLGDGLKEPPGRYKTAAAVLEAVRGRYSSLASSVKQASSKVKLSVASSRFRSGTNSSSSGSRASSSSSSSKASGRDEEGGKGGAETAAAGVGKEGGEGEEVLRAKREEWEKEVEEAVWHTADEAAWTAALKVLEGDKVATYKVVEFEVPKYLDMLKEREGELREAGLWPMGGVREGEEEEGEGRKEQQQRRVVGDRGQEEVGDKTVVAAASGGKGEGGGGEGKEMVAAAAAALTAAAASAAGSSSSSTSSSSTRELSSEGATAAAGTADDVASDDNEQHTTTTSSSSSEEEDQEDIVEAMKGMVDGITTMQLRSMAEVGALNVATTADRFVAKFMLVFGLLQEWGPFFTFAATNGNLLASFATSVVFLSGDLLLAAVASQRWVDAQKRWAAEELGL